ncbi:ATP-binding protein [Parabacteroides distasonis]|uniref:ATP-binding protein n=1 Tax=Parabacteroides distasonis TaxID=823 RepID=UPI0018A9EC5E|nr:ATP-binding protein [Parabacteroides distasonis]MDB9078503.1 ATP-binding protein [Parabacteroides distasonis]
MNIATDFIRKFPIGVQSFESLRKNKYLYVDKTEQIYLLANSGKAFFLSRPRRFGKSLLISTLEAYFQGQKELFEGLAIDKLEKEWKQYPVLHLDLNAELFNSTESLIALLSNQLTQWEQKYGKGEDEVTLSLRFKGVIRRAAAQARLPVVVLIDEYDKPLLQSINNPELHNAYKDILKAFYGVLKSADKDLQFYLLTGVTKFSQVSVFSDLNQLRDISMNDRYNNLCGLTWAEIKRDFQPELKRLGEIQNLTQEQVQEKMTSLYDGYHFTYGSEGLFNPFSVLNVLSDSKFENYWFRTGTPTFLVELLKKTDYDLRHIDGVELDVDSFADYKADATRPIPVIYQSGYLTIKDFNKEFNLYTLGFPNNEVKYGFLNFITPFYTEVPATQNAFYIGKFVQELRAGKTDEFLERLRAFFADFPYELNTKTERHYQVVFYLVFKLMGQFTQAEIRSAKGRADAVVYTPDYIYVFEFKLNGSAREAIQQIDQKGYLIPYIADQQEVIKVGVSFDAKERNLGEWIIE